MSRAGRSKLWTTNRVLALIALILGVGALAGDPYGGGSVRLDTRELARIVEGEVDHVTVGDLADWIIAGDTDFRLIDLRDPASFAEYHIPTAENVPLGELIDYPLFRNEKIVLYSDGGIHSAQAWMLLRAERYHGAYMLLGGLEAWKDEVLFPVLTEDASAERIAAFERARHVSEFFGGTPQTGGRAEAEQAAVVLPTVEMPAEPVVPVRRKKKKEGC